MNKIKKKHSHEEHNHNYNHGKTPVYLYYIGLVLSLIALILNEKICAAAK